MTIGDMLAEARSAVDATYQGWKGGEFTMTGWTQCWLVSECGCEGETLGAVLLDFLLGFGT